MSALGPVSKCEHCGAMAVMWVDLYGLNMANHFRGPAIRKDCRKCGAQHSLGPARDTAATAIEVRAAELAALGIDTPLIWVTRDEQHGWRDYANEDGGGDCRCSEAVRHDANNWHAGYLARVIASHGEQGGER